MNVISNQAGADMRGNHKRLAKILIILSFLARILLGCSLPETPIGDIITSPSATLIIDPTTTVTATVITSSTSTQISSTLTVTPTPTSESVIPVTPTPTGEGSIPPGGVDDIENPRFILQPGTPIGMQNIIDPSAGCNWFGVGGQALSLSGAPVNNLVIEIGGNLEGENVFELGLTGSASMLGLGGYYAKLGDRPVASEGSVWLQLFDLANQPQSRKIYLTTYSECERNLVLINFVEQASTTSFQVVLPFVVKLR